MNSINHKNKLIFIAFLLIVAPFSLSALDWGLMTDHNVSQEGVGSDPDKIHYQAYVVPWLSSIVADNGDLYISAALNAMLEGGGWTVVPELYQTDFAWNFDNGELRFGRTRYSDPLGLIFSGFFDGVSLAFDTQSGTFSAGAWYTGLLYKKTANITVTEDDFTSYYENFSYNKFFNTYFASRRLAFALGWEHPGLMELIRLNVSVLGQVDLNGRDTQLHSQYLAVKAGMPLGDYLVLDLGGALSFAEISDKFQTGLAGELGLSVFLPGALSDRLRFTGIFSSGKSGGISPFIPVTTAAQGDILKAKISGLSLLCLDYTARIHKTFSFSVASTYFVLSDLGTYQGWPGEKEGHFLGNEFYGKLIWSPFSDLQLNLGGGVFLPVMVNADPDAGIKWKIELNAVLAIF